MSPEKLKALADRIDHEELWRWAGMDHDKMTPEQKDRLYAAVNLRRYADLMGSDTWRIFPPRPNISFRARTFDEVVRMARKDADRGDAAAGKTGDLNYGAILDALDSLPNDIRDEVAHLAKLVREYGKQIGHSAD